MNSKFMGSTINKKINSIAYHFFRGVGEKQ